MSDNKGTNKLLSDIKKYFSEMFEIPRIPEEYQEIAVMIGICEVENKYRYVSFAKLVIHLDGRVSRNTISKILDALYDSDRIKFYNKRVSKKKMGAKLIKLNCPIIEEEIQNLLNPKQDQKEVL